MLHSILLCVCVCLCGGDAASQQINLFRWKDVARFVNIQPWRMLIKQLLCCAVRGRQEMVDRKKFHCCWETDMFYTIRMARVITVDSRGRKYLCRRWKWRQAQSLSIQTNREHISIFYFSVAIDNFRGFFIMIYCINIILFFYIEVNRNVRIYESGVWYLAKVNIWINDLGPCGVELLNLYFFSIGAFGSCFNIWRIANNSSILRIYLLMVKSGGSTKRFCMQCDRRYSNGIKPCDRQHSGEQ